MNMLEHPVNVSPSDSRFSWVVQGHARGGSDLFDVPLYEDAAAVVVPSVGGLVPGWCLIVPRTQSVNVQRLGAERVELSSARAFVVRALGALPGTPFEFEHGASYLGGIAGCGVDQAHLHMVPLSFDLAGAALEAGRALRFGSDVSDPWSLIEPGRDYWLIRNVPTGEARCWFIQLVLCLRAFVV